MSMIGKFAVVVRCAWLLVVVAASAAQAGVYELSAAGVITVNASDDASIAVGTPWAFELRYDTAAPDLDFELLGAAEPTYGRFKNTAVPAALVAFHYQAGDYEVTLDDPANFGASSEMLITFTSIHAIDINIHSPALFPQLGGGEVGFHADFNAFDAAPVLANDGLPTDTALGTASFDESTVTLLPPRGYISGSGITQFSIREVPEPGTAGMLIAVGLAAGAMRRCNRLQIAK
jgi:hypothetical protein